MSKLPPNNVLSAVVLITTTIVGTLAALHFTGSFSYETKIKGEIGFHKTKDSVGRDDRHSIEQPTKESTGDKTGEKTKNFAGNITDIWISVRSKKSYFILENSEGIEISENDDNHRKKTVGKGVRRGNEIIVQFTSTLDEVDGVLKLQINPDGKSMSGKFSVLNDGTKEGAVQMVRTPY